MQTAQYTPAEKTANCAICTLSTKMMDCNKCAFNPCSTCPINFYIDCRAETPLPCRLTETTETQPTAPASHRDEHAPQYHNDAENDQIIEEAVHSYACLG